MFNQLPKPIIDSFEKLTKRSKEEFKWEINYQTNLIKNDLKALPKASLKNQYKVKKHLASCLRRIHEYCIQQVFAKNSKGSFYIDKDSKKYKLKSDSTKLNDVKFEHIIPMAVIVDELVAGRMSLIQAMFPPTALTTKLKDKKLRENKLGKSTRHIQKFWKRYEQAGIPVKNNFQNVITGEDIDPNKWTLAKHYKMLGIK